MFEQLALYPFPSLLQYYKMDYTSIKLVESSLLLCTCTLLLLAIIRHPAATTLFLMPSQPKYATLQATKRLMSLHKLKYSRREADNTNHGAFVSLDEPQVATSTSAADAA